VLLQPSEATPTIAKTNDANKQKLMRMRRDKRSSVRIFKDFLARFSGKNDLQNKRGMGVYQYRSEQV